MQTGNAYRVASSGFAYEVMRRAPRSIDATRYDATGSPAATAPGLHMRNVYGRGILQKRCQNQFVVGVTLQRRARR